MTNLAVETDDLPGGQHDNGDHATVAAGDITFAWPADADRDLAAAADTLSDIEALRIASENRLRQMTRPADQLDKDGKRRGFGWDLRSPAVKALATMVATMLCDSPVAVAVLGPAEKKKAGCCLEHDATRNLARALHAHPLGAWVKGQKGIGEKQGGRLIAEIGDPFTRPAMLREDETWDPERPRTVAELWAYCGYRPGQRRKRGERANWSAGAKMRAFNVSQSMLKAGNREVYDKRKALTEGRVHEGECVRCGPSGKPAQPGSKWSDAHRHADALRILSKHVLRELWREGRRIHLEAHITAEAGRITARSLARVSAVPFTVEEDGPEVTWGTATADEHRKAILTLAWCAPNARNKGTGPFLEVIREAAPHQAAIRLIEENGVQCLADIAA